MSDTPYVRAAMAQAALELVLPVIRNTLLEDQGFREDYGLESDAVLAFGDSGVAIQRSTLFDAIREILSSVTERCVTDTDNREWIIKNEAENGDSPTLVISADERRFLLPDFTVLSPDSAIRLRSLNDIASDVNLSTKAQDTWSSVLSERTLKDEEIDLIIIVTCY